MTAEMKENERRCIMKVVYVTLLLAGMSLMCYSQTGKSERQKKIDLLISLSRGKPEKVDAATLTPEQLKDIWKKQISQMYYIYDDGSLRQDKKYEWQSEKGWCMNTNAWSGLSMLTRFTVKRSVGEGIWLATKDSGATIYVKPKNENDFSSGLTTNVYLNMLTGHHTIESESGVKVKINYHDVTEVTFRRPTNEDVTFLLENGKSFSIVLPRKVTCPDCNGTGSVKSSKKMGTRYMDVTEFCKTCNTRKTIEIPLLCTLSK
jgi:hypothetical protein